MAIPTVLMVGVERLPLVPEYLNLGSIVVIAPDLDTLNRWIAEHAPPNPTEPQGGS